MITPAILQHFNQAKANALKVTSNFYAHNLNFNTIDVPLWYKEYYLKGYISIYIYIYIYIPNSYYLFILCFYFLIVSVGKFNLDCFHLRRHNLNISTCFVTPWISDVSLHLFPLSPADLRGRKCVLSGGRVTRKFRVNKMGAHPTHRT